MLLVLCTQVSEVKDLSMNLYLVLISACSPVFISSTWDLNLFKMPCCNFVQMTDGDVVLAGLLVALFR